MQKHESNGPPAQLLVSPAIHPGTWKPAPPLLWLQIHTPPVHPQALQVLPPTTRARAGESRSACGRRRRCSRWASCSAPSPPCRRRHVTSPRCCRSSATSSAPSTATAGRSSSCWRLLDGGGVVRRGGGTPTAMNHFVVSTVCSNPPL